MTVPLLFNFENLKVYPVDMRWGTKALSSKRRFLIFLRVPRKRKETVQIIDRWFFIDYHWFIDNGSLLLLRKPKLSMKLFLTDCITNLERLLEGSRTNPTRPAASIQMRWIRFVWRINFFSRLRQKYFVHKFRVKTVKTITAILNVAFGYRTRRLLLVKRKW